MGSSRSSRPRCAGNEARAAGAQGARPQGAATTMWARVPTSQPAAAGQQRRCVAARASSNVSKEGKFAGAAPTTIDASSSMDAAADARVQSSDLSPY